MKICFVGPADSAHIIKWCKWFSDKGHEVHVVSFTFGEIENVVVHQVAVNVDVNGGDFQKLKYLTTGRKIRRINEKIKPDVINVHYATSYGVAVALSGIRQYILSVWGADIYDFPKKSFLHKMLLKYSLKKAGRLFSTSRAMAVEAAKYTKRSFEITPFGVDTELFSPSKRNRVNQEPLIVGTVKGLSDKYGIRNILEAVADINKEGVYPIALRIAGKGPQEDEYRDLARTLGIEGITSWLGFISQEAAATEWANMDVAVIPSTLESESFGVSAVEAQASGTPVVISDIPGLMEATEPGKTSIVVRRNNTPELKKGIEELLSLQEKRRAMAMAGRQYVLEHYSLNDCFTRIEELMQEYAKSALLTK